MKYTVLVDMDGVLVNHIQTWCDFYNKKYGENLTVEEFGGTWDLHKNVREDVGEKVYDLLFMPQFYNFVEPLEGALAGFEKLVNHKNFDTYVVSAYGGNANQAFGKCEWLKKHTPFLDPEHIILCCEKSLIFGDFLIDDSEKNLIKWEETWKSYDSTAIMMTALHNKDCAGFARVNNWQDILNYLEIFI